MTPFCKGWCSTTFPENPLNGISILGVTAQYPIRALGLESNEPLPGSVALTIYGRLYPFPGSYSVFTPSLIKWGITHGEYKGG